MKSLMYAPSHHRTPKGQKCCSPNLFLCQTELQFLQTKKMTSPKEKMTLKLLVDKQNKRVVFAESDKDFVDIIFSFLTMPIGAIIRILNKQSSLGCMDELYESIENLHEDCFNTQACKTMLLNPLNAYREHYEDLVLRIDDHDPQSFYTCNKPECAIKKFPFFSSVPKARCGCGEIMDLGWSWGKEEWKGPNRDGVFVKGMTNFLITDDLHVMPASTTAIQNVFEKLGIEDWVNIEETAIDLDVDKLCDLLKRSLLSKSPLSDIYFQETNMDDDVQFLPTFRAPPKSQVNSTHESKSFKAKFIICKSSNKVMYAEAGEGFMDLLFSFLTFPLGSIVKLLDKFSSIGCVDDLYKSVEKLSAASCSNGIKSVELKSVLLDPKLATYFACSNSPLPGIELSAAEGDMYGCHTCFIDSEISMGTTHCCRHGVKHVSFAEMNPKLQATKEVGGGYAKKETKFMITDELQVTPFSALGSVQTAKNRKIDFASLEEKEIDIGEHEAVNLLKACLTSPNPLSDIFVPNKQQKRVH